MHGFDTYACSAAGVMGFANLRAIPSESLPGTCVPTPVVQANVLINTLLETSAHPVMCRGIPLPAWVFSAKDPVTCLQVPGGSPVPGDANSLMIGEGSEAATNRMTPLERNHVIVVNREVFWDLAVFIHFKQS